MIRCPALRQTAPWPHKSKAHMSIQCLLTHVESKPQSPLDLHAAIITGGLSGYLDVVIGIGCGLFVVTATGGGGFIVGPACGGYCVILRSKCSCKGVEGVVVDMYFEVHLTVGSPVVPGGQVQIGLCLKMLQLEFLPHIPS